MDESKILKIWNFWQNIDDPNKCFCQMCKRLTSRRYIERNDIEKNPAYAWDQMYLNLCLECSKDYKLLRNNEIIWQQFVQSIMRENPLQGESIEIKIGGMSVTFTATHLAEVQEIFRNEGWGEKAPRRKPVLGKSDSDEGEDESAVRSESQQSGAC